MPTFVRIALLSSLFLTSACAKFAWVEEGEANENFIEGPEDSIDELTDTDGLGDDSDHPGFDRQPFERVAEAPPVGAGSGSGTGTGKSPGAGSGSETVPVESARVQELRAQLAAKQSAVQNILPHLNARKAEAQSIVAQLNAIKQYWDSLPLAQRPIQGPHLRATAQAHQARLAVVQSEAQAMVATINTLKAQAAAIVEEIKDELGIA